MNNAKYKFKQAELYTICRFILALLTIPEILARFTALKGKYTPTWVTTRLTEVDTAEDAPSEQQRNSVHETIRIELLTLVQQALLTFRQLERYIVEITPPPLQKASIEAAGGNYYTAASDSDFDACQQMLNAALLFTTDNNTALQAAGQNMPPAFLTNLTNLHTTFQNKHTDFITSEGGAEVLTSEKINLNNGIYTNIIQAVNADAQTIYIGQDEEAHRQQFTLDHQLYLVRGAGVAGMRFHVTDATTGADIPDTTIAIPSKDVTLTSDASGRALKLQLAEGNYVVKAEKPGYITWQQTITITSGTVKRVDIKLTI